MPCEDGLMDRTQLVTLDVLARELGMSLDNVRYRFKQLRRSNQLVDGEDFIRDDYVNETNFVYRVDAARFYLKAGFPSLVGERPLASTALPFASDSPSSSEMSASSSASDTPSENSSTASASLANVEILRERLSFKEEQIEWKEEQLDEVREELSTLREERKMFTRALTQAFETIQTLNANLMTIAAPGDRSAIASRSPSRASSLASDEGVNSDESASEVIRLSSSPASESGDSFPATS